MIKPHFLIIHILFLKVLYQMEGLLIKCFLLLFQESQESSVSFVNSVSGSSSYNPQRQHLSSPMEYPSPYHTEYSG